MTTSAIPAHERGFFTEDDSVAVVVGRNADAKNPRLKSSMEIITRHLHEAVKEIEPSQAEWMSTIQFLTQTGHLCDDWRQEFILLSDTLGVSMLVDAINSRRPTGAAQNSVLGPFHVVGAPERQMGDNISLDGEGENMFLHGRILDLDCHPIQGVRMDVWQANDEGFYDVQQRGIQPEFNLRGVFHTEADGRYWFKGVKPKYYPIPSDGTVGALLDALGRHPMRPAHFHYILTKEGYDEVVTHIFDPDDPYIESDAVFGVRESLLAQFNLIEDAEQSAEHGFDGPFYDVEHNFVLARSRPAERQ